MFIFLTESLVLFINLYIYILKSFIHLSFYMLHVSKKMCLIIISLKNRSPKLIIIYNLKYWKNFIVIVVIFYLFTSKIIFFDWYLLLYNKNIINILYILTFILLFSRSFISCNYLLFLFLLNIILFSKQNFQFNFIVY